jgi:hypothetical protein
LKKGLSPDFRFLEFGLGPLKGIDPRVLVSGDDDVDGFVLSLALAYNDIKTIQWINFILEKHQPSNTNEISADAGQWNGMRVQAARWLMALAHEVILAIARAKEIGLLERAPLKRVIRALPRRYRQLWKELVAVSTKSSAPGVKLRPYLRNLRNFGAFHYKYSEDLLKAYREFFLTGPSGAHNEWAYFSIGPSLRETRFFFADAAVQRMYTGDESLDALFAETSAFLNELHHTLSGFVLSYIISRSE